jgi:histidyl-tRNA synthetase
LRLQVNNRKLIEGFYLGVGAQDAAAVMRVIDRIDKVPTAALRTMLVEDAGLDAKQADSCLALATIRAPDASFVDQVRALGVEHPLLDTGLDELAAVISGAAAITSQRVSVEADLSIARGLDYYTGTVFETRMSGSESLGSICSGGRYDSLASDGRTTYPGVGISLGVTRMLIPLFNSGRLTASRSVPSVVLVALVDEESRDSSDTVAQALRLRGIAAEVAPSAQKFGKQIRTAERRGIPFVWFPDQSEVKDIRSGEQVAADPATWIPPAGDLKPQVVVIEAGENT